MREIKFRAISIYGGLVYGTGIFYDTVNAWLLSHDSSKCLADGFNKNIIDNKTIMQYTNLKDKNRKEVYEGDVIKVIRKHWNNCSKEYVEKVTEEIGEVVFYKNCEVALKTKEKDGTLYQPFLWIFKDKEDYEIEILGNIYEDKELLSK